MIDSNRMVQEVITALADDGVLPRDLTSVSLEPDQYIDDLGIDSLGLCSLFSEIEKRLGRSLPEDALVTVRRVGDLFRVLDESAPQSI